VEGAVGMVEMALECSRRRIDQLDEERKAAVVSSLLVVLCGERPRGPSSTPAPFTNEEMAERKTFRCASTNRSGGSAPLGRRRSAQPPGRSSVGATGALRQRTREKKPRLLDRDLSSFSRAGISVQCARPAGCGSL
jgi:hypothetical protein